MQALTREVSSQLQDAPLLSVLRGFLNPERHGLLGLSLLMWGALIVRMGFWGFLTMVIVDYTPKPY